MFGKLVPEIELVRIIGGRVRLFEDIEWKRRELRETEERAVVVAVNLVVAVMTAAD